MENSLLFDFLALLPENASQSEIENAYKALAQIYHPDRNPERISWANEKMKQLNEAKELLLDPSKRTLFVQRLKNKKVQEGNQTNHLKKLKSENIELINALKKNNVENGLLTILLVLLGATLIAGENTSTSNRRSKY